MAISLIVLLGCTPVSEDQSGQLTTPNFSLITDPADIAVCGGTGATNNDHDGIDRTCLLQGDIPLNFDLAPGVFESSILGALNSWNFYLKELNTMPLLERVYSGGIPFIVHSASASNQYCGETPGGSGGRVAKVDIWPSSSTQCNMAGSCTLEEIAVHELAHVLGWNGGHGGSPGSANSYTYGCATFLHIGFVPLSSSACHHDVEALFRAREHSSGWTYSVDYVTSPILWYTDAPSTVSMPAATSSQLNITKWRGTTGSSTAKGNSSVNWVSGNSSIFTVSATGLVAGVAPGSANLYLKALGSPSNFTVWTPFTVNGDSVTVNVTQSPFAVTSDETPLVTQGYHTFTAHVGSPGASHSWSIDDSRTLYTIPDTTFTTPNNSATIWVEAGSYTLRFKVEGQVQDIPVCTDVGEALTGSTPEGEKSVGTKFQPGQDLVEGCGGSGGGGGGEGDA